MTDETLKRSKIRSFADDPSIDLSIDTINLGKQALVFVNTKKSAESLAEKISVQLKKLKYNQNPELSKKAENVLQRPTVQCKRLARCTLQNVAFHHAGLASKQKELIEEKFKEGIIKIICCTPTLAAGLDLPAFRTILRDLKRFGHRGLSYIPVLEYAQMAGRAGRPKYDKIGESIIISKNEDEKEELSTRYIFGEVENIYSKLAVEPVLRSQILSIVASEFAITEEKIMSFFEKTFWAYQFGDLERMRQIIEKILIMLEEWSFLNFETKEGKEFVIATDIGKRVSQLYLDPLTANHLIDCMRRSKDTELKDISFLQMVSRTLEMRPLLRVKVKEMEEVETESIVWEPNLIDNTITEFDFEYDEFLRSIKTAMFFKDWVEEKDEEFLLERYDIRPGEIKVKLDIADWLFYSCSELAILTKQHEIVKDIKKVRTRLKHGIKEELLPLIRLKGVGRVKARKLHDAGIKDLGDVKSCDTGKMSWLIGPKLTEQVKDQVGITVDKEKLKVKTNKRKGQFNLSDFY